MHFGEKKICCNLFYPYLKIDLIFLAYYNGHGLIDVSVKGKFSGSLTDKLPT